VEKYLRIKMRTQLINASKMHYQAHIEKHRINIEVMLNNPTAIPEHSDLMDAIEKEVAIIAEYMDKLEVLNRYFN
jgi:hypothetical protein